MSIQNFMVRKENYADIANQGQIERAAQEMAIMKAEGLVEKYRDFKGIPASMKLTQAEKQNNPHLDKKAVASGGKGRKAKKSLKKRRSRKGKSRRGTKKTKK